MASISENLAWLGSLTRPIEAAKAGGTMADLLTPFRPGVANPGAIEAFIHVPEGLPPGAPLVVALHGCTQTAADYDHGTGWSQLADQLGFALLVPQQSRGNNPNLCFNWFQAADIARAGGESESIANLTRAAVAAYAIDPARVFVTGLSAGGAMTAVMLATYPDIFAGGAVIGGLPYGCATSVGDALQRMRGQGHAASRTATDRARTASGGTVERWPTLSLWHGSRDTTVVPENMAALGRQWRGLHDLPAQPTTTDTGKGWTHQRWQDSEGHDLVEEWRIEGMGHGVPIDPATGYGSAAPYMLDVGLDSTAMIAAAWGLGTAAPRAVDAPQSDRAPKAHDVTTTIENALRTAGLMR